MILRHGVIFKSKGSCSTGESVIFERSKGYAQKTMGSCFGGQGNSCQFWLHAGAGDSHQGLTDHWKGCCGAGEGTPPAPAHGGPAEHVAPSATFSIWCKGQLLSLTHDLTEMQRMLSVQTWTSAAVFTPMRPRTICAASCNHNCVMHAADLCACRAYIDLEAVSAAYIALLGRCTLAAPCGWPQTAV